MTIRVYDTVTITGSFTKNGAYYDPSDYVVLYLKKPNLDFITYTYSLAEINKTATGRYDKEISLDRPGLWSYVWYTQDATNGHVESGGSFMVDNALSDIIKS